MVHLLTEYLICWHRKLRIKLHHSIRFHLSLTSAYIILSSYLILGSSDNVGLLSIWLHGKTGCFLFLTCNVYFLESTWCLTTISGSSSLVNGLLTLHYLSISFVQKNFTARCFYFDVEFGICNSTSDHGLLFIILLVCEIKR